MALRTLSVATGIGMLDHGVEWALELGGESIVPILYVEREAHAAALLAHKMEEGALAQAPIWSDARTLCGPEVGRVISEAGGIDLLIGGIPCQPYSQAGNRRGHDDERDLWQPVRAAIALYRPGIVFIENVSGFVSAGRPEQGAPVVLRDLEALGYTATVELLGSKECGGSHLRQRSWLMAHDSRNRLQGGWREAYLGRVARRHLADRCNSALADGNRNGTGEYARVLPQDESEYAGRSTSGGHGYHAGGDPMADAPHRDRRCRECRAKVGIGESEERRRRLASECAGLPRYAPPQGDYGVWNAVAELAPERLPALSKRETAEREVQRVADGDAARRLQLRAVGNSVDPVAACISFILLVAAIHNLEAD